MRRLLSLLYKIFEQNHSASSSAQPWHVLVFLTCTHRIIVSSYSWSLCKASNWLFNAPTWMDPIFWSNSERESDMLVLKQLVALCSYSGIALASQSHCSIRINDCMYFCTQLSQPQCHSAVDFIKDQNNHQIDDDCGGRHCYPNIRLGLWVGTHCHQGWNCDAVDDDAKHRWKGQAKLRREKNGNKLVSTHPFLSSTHGKAAGINISKIASM